MRQNWLGPCPGRQILQSGPYGVREKAARDAALRELASMRRAAHGEVGGGRLSRSTRSCWIQPDEAALAGLAGHHARKAVCSRTKFSRFSRWSTWQKTWKYPYVGIRKIDRLAFKNDYHARLGFSFLKAGQPAKVAKAARPCRQLSQKSTQTRATAARKVSASLS